MSSEPCWPPSPSSSSSSLCHIRRRKEEKLLLLLLSWEHSTGCGPSLLRHRWGWDPPSSSVSVFILFSIGEVGEAKRGRTVSASVRRREFIASDVKEEERAFAFPIQCYRYTIYAGGRKCCAEARAFAWAEIITKRVWRTRKREENY